MCSKRCNSNDAISVFEILARELRATLLSNLSSRGLRGLTAVHVGGGGARPIGGRREACGAWPGHSRRRPIGGRREACGAWPGFETRHRAQLGCQVSRAGRPRGGRRSGGNRKPGGGRRSGGNRKPGDGRRSGGDAIRQKSGGPQENLGTTTHAFTDVN